MKVLACLFAALALLFASPSRADTSVTIGWQFLPLGLQGGPQIWENAYELWGNGYVEVPVSFPVSGQYSFTLNAKPKPGDSVSPLSEVRLDQIPIGVGSTFSQRIPTSGNYIWSSYVTEGQHKVAVSLMNQGSPPSSNLFISSLTITLLGASERPAEPPGWRDPWQQPYSSYSIWNTPIGSGAVWSGALDADTIDLRHTGAVNAGQWSIPFFLPVSRIPMVITTTDETYPAPTFYNWMPLGSAPAQPVSGGDHHLIVYSNDRTTIFNGYGCVPVVTGFQCQLSQVENVCTDSVGAYSWGAGAIRSWELKAGRIKHMLRYAIPTAYTKAGDTWISGLAWPAMRSDYNGPKGLYTGHVLYGSTIGIPSTIDVTQLRLTPSGLALAQALQDYGALQRDTAGSSGVTFYAEQAAEGSAELTDMRADLPKIVPYLAIMRNQGPASVNGGGSRRQPWLPGVFDRYCSRP